MTEQEINAGNEIIAHWEGLNWFEFKGDIATIRSWNDKEGMTVYGNDFKDEYYTIPYHQDWRWLMCVVERIQKIGVTVRIENLTCTIIQIGDSSKPQYHNRVHYTGQPYVEMVWRAVVDFIKWHKENGI